MSKKYRVLSLELGTYIKIKPEVSDYPKYSVFESREQAANWIDYVYSSPNRHYFEIVEFEDEKV